MDDYLTELKKKLEKELPEMYQTELKKNVKLTTKPNMTQRIKNVTVQRAHFIIRATNVKKILVLLMYF